MLRGHQVLERSQNRRWEGEEKCQTLGFGKAWDRHSGKSKIVKLLSVVFQPPTRKVLFQKRA